MQLYVPCCAVRYAVLQCVAAPRCLFKMADLKHLGLGNTKF